MKEQRITLEIDPMGRITADAEGFSGDVCLKELEHLLEALAPGTATVTRKPDAGTAQRVVARSQSLSQGKKP